MPGIDNGTVVTKLVKNVVTLSKRTVAEITSGALSFIPAPTVVLSRPIQASLNHTALTLDPRTTTLTLGATPPNTIEVGCDVRPGGGIAPRTTVVGYTHPHLEVSVPILVTLASEPITLHPEEVDVPVVGAVVAGQRVTAATGVAPDTTVVSYSGGVAKLSLPITGGELGGLLCPECPRLLHLDLPLVPFHRSPLDPAAPHPPPP